MQIWVNESEIVRSTDYVLTLGTFDGLHLGHAAMLRHVVKVAKSKGAKSVAITLHPHPRIVLGKADGLELLSSLSERIELFRENGIDILYIMRFDPKLAATSPESFLIETLYNGIGFKKLIVGHDHAFGRNREGDYELLNQIADSQGFEIEKFGPHSAGGDIVSSTKIRNHLKSGELLQANLMLGYNYFLIGKVISGDRRGRSIGYPTANVEPEEPLKIKPANGVYFVAFTVNRTRYFGLCNIGSRPTFKSNDDPVVEVHIPSVELSIYGEQVRVEFLHRHRSEKRFSGKEELLNAISDDKAIAKKYLASLDNKEDFANFANYIDNKIK